MKWISVYESEPPKGIRCLFKERGTEHIICSFPHPRLWEEKGHDLWMPIQDVTKHMPCSYCSPWGFSRINDAIRRKNCRVCNGTGRVTVNG